MLVAIPLGAAYIYFVDNGDAIDNLGSTHRPPASGCQMAGPRKVAQSALRVRPAE